MPPAHSVLVPTPVGTLAVDSDGSAIVRVAWPADVEAPAGIDSVDPVLPKPSGNSAPILPASSPNSTSRSTSAGCRMPPVRF